jgi:hypothetical protein
MIMRPCLLLAGVAVACAPIQPSGMPPNGAMPATVRPTGVRSPSDTNGLIPAGFGTLRQTDIAIKVDLPDIEVWLFPLDASVIRVLAPDTYRSLVGVLESKKTVIERLAQAHGLRERRLWYVTFNGLAPDARFDPQDVTITAQGRAFTPLEVIPLTTGFGQQRLQPHETQKALYLFDDGLDVSQPLTVAMGTMQVTTWETILQAIESEQAAIRARAGGG